MKAALRAGSCGDEAQKKLYTRRYSSRLTNTLVSVDVSSHRVRINVSGMVYETMESTLARFPDSLLGSTARRKHFYDSVTDEYFFERNRNAFDAILFYYQSYGLLSRPSNVSLEDFCEEMRFFGFGEEIIQEFRRDEGEIVPQEKTTGPLPSNKTLKSIWLMLEYPDTNLTAKLVAVWSISFITLSTFILCAETIPEIANMPKIIGSYTIMAILEMACVIWFTLEYILRFVASPNKWKFASSMMNIIDLIAFLPYYIELAPGDSLGFRLDGFRVLRVCRIFKLGRHLGALQVLFKTMVATWRELVMMLFFLIMGVIIFSSLVFYADLDEPLTHFKSIPEAAWWSVITFTNVGYGDSYPLSAWGKLIGTFCALAGVLVLALPSPVFVNQFRVFYEMEKKQKQMKRKLTDCKS